MEVRLTVTPSVLGAFLFVLAWLGCAAPAQRGQIEVLPGAEQRAMILQKLGLLRVGDSTQSAHALRAAREELLPTGPAASSRVGDYLLENGVTGAAIGAIDGTSRGGRLLDLWRKPGEEGLGDLDLYVLGKLVRYETLRIGADLATGAATIEVSATIDRATEGLGRVSVATRYDLAPGVSAVFVHTQIKTEISPEAGEPVELLREALSADEARVADGSSAGAASLGARAGFFVHPLSPGTQVAPQRSAVLVRHEGALPAVGESLLVSRVIVPLERPDRLSAALAEARLLGEPQALLRVQLSQEQRPVTKLPRLSLTLRREDGRVLDARGLEPCPPDSSYAIEVPRGTYALSIEEGSILAEPRRVRVADPEVRVGLGVTRASAPSTAVDEFPFVVRCPKLEQTEF